MQQTPRRIYTTTTTTTTTTIVATTTTTTQNANRLWPAHACLGFPLSAIRYRRIRYRRRELCVMFRRVFCVFRIFYIFLYWRVTMFAPPILFLPEQVITSVNNMENIDVLDLRRLL